VKRHPKAQVSILKIKLRILKICGGIMQEIWTFLKYIFLKNKKRRTRVVFDINLKY